MIAVAQTAVNNCIVLIIFNTTGKFFMKIEESQKYKSNLIKFLTHKKECKKHFSSKEEQELLEETIRMYFNNQISTDSFEKVDVTSKGENVFHIYTATLNKKVIISNSKVNLVDPKKISGSAHSIEVSKTQCLITDFTKEIAKQVHR